MDDARPRTAADRAERGRAQRLKSRLRSGVQRTRRRSLLTEVAIGIVAAAVAVAIRWTLPLQPQQLPTITVVILLAVVTTFIGVLAGIVTAVVGGLLSWYVLFSPQLPSLAGDVWIPLLGFAVIATVIVGTSHLYRTSEQRLHAEEMAKLEAQAANAEFFAREMAHRMKNALMIVQSIAFQTIGARTPEAVKFAARLRTLSNANELLSEHVSKPKAEVGQVVEAALEPFGDARTNIRVEAAEAMIASGQVVMLSLALHELATNAVKYGALSVPTGRVELVIEDAGDRLNLTWKEHGGPPVSVPEIHGFGTRLLRRSGMDTALDFEPDGICCSFGLRKS